jgi:hypothetical protein
MKNVGELLRDADPLQHEPVVSLRKRDLQRQAVLAAASSAHIGPQARSRIVLFVAVAAAIMASFAGARIWTSFSPEVEAAVRFEVRLAEDKPAPGLREAKVQDTGRSIYLHPDVVVSNGDIAEARIVPISASQYNVRVTLTKTGADKMHVATSGHIGRLVAILLDGQVVMAPVIRSSIDDSAVITGNLTKAQAETIVKGITRSSE